MRKILISCVLLIATAHVSAQENADIQQMQKFAQVYKYLSSLYVDEVEMAPMVESAIRGMLGELDPHSGYIDIQEAQGFRESLDGKFSGIGVEFNTLRDTVIVVNTIAGGPAERVGVRANDRIVKIDTLNAVGLSRADVPKYLRGDRGTKVAIEVIRPGEMQPLHFIIQRDLIPLNTLDAAYMATQEVGYIKINRFGHTTMQEFETAYEKLKKPKNLILDLRGNGGGLLDQAIALAGFFLPKGAVVVSTEGRAVSPMTYTTPRNGENLNGRVVVLIDESSASASEIVTGAIQDWDRGIVVGRPSFGKGLVQRLIPLNDGSAVRITVARYHTPSGRVIQRAYEKGNQRAYYLDHLRRYNDAVRDSLDANTPTYKTLRTKRTVHGGGGIRPDILVENDTTHYSNYYGELNRRGILIEFANTTLDRDRADLLERYPTFERFEREFSVSDSLLAELTTQASQQGVAYDAAQFDRSRMLIATQFKALAAQRLYGLEAYFKVVNPALSNAYNQAVALFNDWERQAKPLLSPEK